MRSKAFMRPVAVPVAVVGILAAALTACTPPSQPLPTQSWRFDTTSIRINKSQDKTCAIACFNTKDDVYTVNIAFRVKVGEPNSAQTWVVRGSKTPGLSEGQSYSMTGTQRAPTQFDDVTLADVGDLALGRPLEIVGVWTWPMERDFDYPESAINEVSTIVRNQLNNALANKQAIDIPKGAGEIISWVYGQIGLSGVAHLLSTYVWNIVGIPDDPVGSRIYAGIGARGALADAADLFLGGSGKELPSIPFSYVRVPPDINGGRVFRLGSPASTSITGQRMTGSTGDYTMSYLWTRTDSGTTPTTPPTEPTVTEPTEPTVTEPEPTTTLVCVPNVDFQPITCPVEPL
ncbi:hypothetical protein [Dermatobacter hominis]|uniref:hypothetical protein n=1 Tax=Dermatobacter hominis TaxID=2884263 RepID=UPI001D126EEF|nr:hypothetical protein [Dermatobacter hominis]UDY34951.1 hypothetical protein LH044_16630 [Dermatobacter hominis]